MKKTFLFILMLAGIPGFAQIPAGYYNSATGNGLALKTQLKTIITAGHNGKSYDNLFTDPKAFKATDVDLFYENDGSVLDMYSEKPNAADSYNYHYVAGDKCGNYDGESDCYNGEHVVPQSTYSSGMPMVGDILQLLPTDGYVNNRRSNFPYANISSPTWTSTNGSKLGNISVAGYSGKAFEPIDEFKGDIARILFYFATRYETQVDNYTSFPMFNGSEGMAFKPAFLQILLAWHIQDPVSPMEIYRNNKAYLYQGNRNPYIDHPEYITSIWGMPLGIDDLKLSKASVYPNPSNNHRINIQSEAILDQIQLVSINGQIIQQIQKPQMQDNIYSLDNLPQGFYLLKLTSGNSATTKKVIVN
jgi:endonuclease I